MSYNRCKDIRKSANKYLPSVYETQVEFRSHFLGKSASYGPRNTVITKSLLQSNMVKFSTPSSAGHFRMNLRGDRSMKAATTAKVGHRSEYWSTVPRRILHSPLNTFFPTLKELLCTHMASQTSAEMVLSPDSLSDL